MKNLFVLALASLLAVPAFGQVTIDANRDSGFFAAGFDGMGNPSFTINNFGAHTHVPVGQANSDRVNRGIFDFDIAGNIPGGATITAATFEFEVTNQGGSQGMAAVDFSLHRVTAPWTEGTGVGNIGVATMDGVTWANAMDDPVTPVPWATLGGDFDAATSGTVLVDGPNGVEMGEAPIIYSISSAKLISDIQAIVDGTEDNDGFLLKADPEGVNGSAARVTTREGGNAAKLIIEFSTGMVLLGDVNLDGMVNLLDVAPFVTLLADGGFQEEADINEDDVVNLLDVQPFVDLLAGGG